MAVNRSFGVEDGNDFVDAGLSSEIDELAYVYQQMHQRELPEELPADIVNARAGRLLAGGDPQVLPWGAWAEFGNRHIGMWIGKVDYQYRHMQGAADTRRRTLSAQLDAQLGHLTMYPVASTWRTKGQHGTEADLSQIDKAIDVAVRAPELVTYDFWAFIENGANYEPVKRGMPPSARPGSRRLQPTCRTISPCAPKARSAILKPPAIEALDGRGAATTSALLSRVAQRYKTNEQLMAKVRELTGPRVAYDMWAIDSAINTARDADDRIALRRQACELTVSQCLELASELVAKDEAAAAAEYEKAFRNPALDAVAMTWSQRLAGAGTTSAPTSRRRRSSLPNVRPRSGQVRGMLTLARLHERRSQLDEADELFSERRRSLSGRDGAARGVPVSAGRRGEEAGVPRSLEGDRARVVPGWPSADGDGDEDAGRSTASSSRRTVTGRGRSACRPATSSSASMAGRSRTSNSSTPSLWFEPQAKSRTNSRRGAACCSRSISTRITG